MNSSTTPPGGMATGSNVGMIAGVILVCVFTVTICVVIGFCVWRKKKREREECTNRKGRTPTRGSSTLRSDKSDHPYENPSICFKQSDRRQKGGNQYAGLAGHSLPHHYQGLGQHPTRVTATGESLYDELMASSEGGSSAYYFKVDPTIPPARLKRDENPTLNTDRPYDQIQIPNTSNNAQEEEDEDESSAYYFKVEGSLKRNTPSQNESDYLVIDEPDGELQRSDTGRNTLDHDRSKSLLNNNTTNKMAPKTSSYDKLDRVGITDPSSPPGDEKRGHEYSQLLPTVAINKNGKKDGSYSTVGLTTNSLRITNEEGDDRLRDSGAYNRLDRGVEKEIDKAND